MKPTKSAMALMPDANRELPYEGAKEMLLVDDVDNKEYLKELLEAMFPELLPSAKKKKSDMANIITGIRILCSIALLFFHAFSPFFYVLYIIAGFSDMIDGAVARKTGTVSEFGAKLDTAADFVLVVVCLIKMLPTIHVPTWLIIWIFVIAVIKAINLVSGYVMRNEIVVLHTVMNKVTGILLFVLPLTLNFIDLKYSGVVVSAAATFAAVQEGHMIRTGAK